MFCKKCGNQLKIGVNFCSKCGNQIGQNEKSLIKNDFIDVEFKRGIYKLENEDFVGAGKIFEELAFTYDSSMAWIYLGLTKFAQLRTGVTNINQILDCFERGTELSLASKKQYQKIYYEVSFEQIQNFSNWLLDIKNKSKKAKSGRFWNTVLLGVAAGYGSHKSDKSNNVFTGVTGVAGSAYALNKMGIHSDEIKNLGDIEDFIMDIIRQLVIGIKSYCGDNQEIWQSFVEKVKQIISSNSKLSEIEKIIKNDENPSNDAIFRIAAVLVGTLILFSLLGAVLDAISQ
jgi:hypothetical protein